MTDLTAILDHGGDTAVLSRAFEAFTESTRKLRNAYGSLREHVDTLNEELEQTNLHLASILESMTSGVAAIDSQGRITTFNKAAETITGLPAAAVIGRPYDTVFSNGSSLFRLTKLLQGDQRQINGETEFKTRAGHVIPLEFACSVMEDKTGRTLGALQVFRDLSTMKKLEEQARRADRLAALGEMAAGVAHEIRNPLGGIGGLAGLLEKDLDTDDPRRRLASRIVAGVQSLNHVVTSLLDFTRPIHPERKPFPLKEAIDSALALLAEPAAEAGVEVRLNGGLHRQTVMADPDLLKQVLLNLLANAVDAMPDGGTLTVSCRERLEDEVIEILVADTGVGIADEDLGKVFNPFFTTKDNGVGMGLAVAHRIIEAHGGRATVSSRLGRGTAFSIVLPATQQE